MVALLTSITLQLLFVVLVRTAGQPGDGALPSPMVAVATNAVLLAVVVAHVTAAVFTFKLASELNSTASGIILDLGSLLWCLGLLVMMVVSGKASTVLKRHGVRVGFFGADPSTL